MMKRNKILAAALASVTMISPLTSVLPGFAQATPVMANSSLDSKEIEVAELGVVDGKYTYQIDARLNKKDLTKYVKNNGENPLYVLIFHAQDYTWDPEDKPVQLYHEVEEDDPIAVKNVEYSTNAAGDLVVEMPADPESIYEGLNVSFQLGYAGSSNASADRTRLVSIRDGGAAVDGAQWKTTITLPQHSAQDIKIEPMLRINGAADPLKNNGVYDFDILGTPEALKGSAPVQKGDIVSVIMEYALSENETRGKEVFEMTTTFAQEYFKLRRVKGKNESNLGWYEKELEKEDGQKLVHKLAQTGIVLENNGQSVKFLVEFEFECLKNPAVPVAVNEDYANGFLITAMLKEREKENQNPEFLINRSLILTNLAVDTAEKPLPGIPDQPSTQTGFVTSNGKVQYIKVDGNLARNEFITVEGSQYYFDAYGNMVKGWLKLSDGKWSWLGADGVRRMNGWMQTDGKWYYFNNGLMQTGWIQIGSDWYYLHSDGVMNTGWLHLGNSWYYTGTNGVMVTGWNKINGHWYYMDSTGRMKTGWLKLEWNGREDWYYFMSNGIMKAGESWYDSIHNKTYRFDSAGICLNS